VTAASPSGPAAAEPRAFRDTYRIIAAQLAPPDLLRDIATPGDVDAVLEVLRLTGVDTDAVVGVLSRVPPADRPTGSGAGWALLAFTHPARPSRFTDGSRGVWYAGGSMRTAIAETAYHDERLLRSFGEPPQARPKQVLHAGVTGMMIDVRGWRRSAPDDYRALHDPDPSRYETPQRFGRARYDVGDDAVVYDSVRDRGAPQGMCLAVLRPRAIRQARPVAMLTFQWTGGALKAGGLTTI
jgi:hypothetical protein